jgi:hypothetical protein
LTLTPQLVQLSEEAKRKLADQRMKESAVDQEVYTQRDHEIAAKKRQEHPATMEKRREKKEGKEYGKALSQTLKVEEDFMRKAAKEEAVSKARSEARIQKPIEIEERRMAKADDDIAKEREPYIPIWTEREGFRKRIREEAAPKDKEDSEILTKKK